MKKRFCRIFSALLVLVLLLEALPAQTLAAVPTWKEQENTAEPMIRLSSAAGKAGDLVTVRVSIENNPGIIAMILDLYYDPNQLALVSVVDEHLLEGGLFSNNIECNPYVMYWDDSLAKENNKRNGIIATLTFRILNSCDQAEVAIIQREGSTFNKVLKDVVFRVENGTVKNQDASVEPPISENPFKDVQSKDWFYDEVLFVSGRGLMNGTSSDQFSPQQFTNRAMIATTLWRLDGSPTVDYDMSFQDVPVGKWHTEAIRWAQMNGLVKGYNNDTFGTTDPITREQMATILYRYAESMGKADDVDGTLTFTDAAKVSPWADKAVRWCVREGFLTGKGNGILDPKGKAKRCEVAAILQRFIEKMNL